MEQIADSLASLKASFGEGYRFHLTGLTHDEYGFPTAKVPEIVAKQNKLKQKTMRHLDELNDVRIDMMDDAHIMVFAYGTTARAARQAIRIARKKRFKVGMVQPLTLWPFPDDIVREQLEHVDLVIVPELNQGQIIGELRRLRNKHIKITGLNKVDGELINPNEIVDKIKEERR